MVSRAEITTSYANAYVKESKKGRGRILDQVVEVPRSLRATAIAPVERRAVAACGGCRATLEPNLCRVLGRLRVL